MRKDLVDAIMEETRLPEARARKVAEVREALIPADSKVLCSLNFSALLILSNGVLIYTAVSFTRMEAEFIPFKDLHGVAVGQTFGYSEHTLTIELKKKETSSVLKRVKYSRITARHLNLKLVTKAQNIITEGIASSKVSSTPNDGPLEQISKLKSLFDVGAISKKEFEAKKAKLLDSI